MKVFTPPDSHFMDTKLTGFLSLQSQIPLSQQDLYQRMSELQQQLGTIETERSRTPELRKEGAEFKAKPAIAEREIEEKIEELETKSD